MTDKQMKQTIHEMEWDDLVAKWKRRKDKDIEDAWGQGKFFEYAIIRAFEIEGAQVRYPYIVHSHHIGIEGNKVLEQIDGAIYVDGLSVIVESKDYKKKNIDIEPLAKLQVRLRRRPSQVIGCLFCDSDMTWPAQMLIESLMPHTILFWSKRDVEYCFTNHCFVEGLKLKYRAVIEYGNHMLDLLTYKEEGCNSFCIVEGKTDRYILSKVFKEVNVNVKFIVTNGISSMPAVARTIMSYKEQEDKVMIVCDQDNFKEGRYGKDVLGFLLRGDMNNPSFALFTFDPNIDYLVAKSKEDRGWKINTDEIERRINNNIESILKDETINRIIEFVRE